MVNALTPDQLKFLAQSPGTYLSIGKPSDRLVGLYEAGLIDAHGTEENPLSMWSINRVAAALVGEYHRAIGGADHG